VLGEFADHGTRVDEDDYGHGAQRLGRDLVNEGGDGVGRRCGVARRWARRLQAGVATAITIGRGTVRKMRQNLAWAVGYNSLALPIAAGVFEPLGFVLRPEVGAISMSGSSVIVAANAIALKRLRLPRS
jgi:hypothetical protein